MNIRSLLMVRPSHFGFNPETADSNTFQQQPTLESKKISELAQKEFDDFVHELKKFNIPVTVFNDLPENILPDAVFPNNWFSTHANGKINIYPMLTPSRQGEVRDDILESLKNKFGYTHTNDYRKEKGICEGTGSLVFDHDHKLAYAVISPRTDKSLTEKIIHDLEYTPVFLEAFNNKTPIYHTNVVMCVAPEFVIVCLDALNLKSLENFIKHTPEEKEVLPITLGQMNTFAGNMLAVDCKAGKFMIMSETAHKSLMRDQVEYIEQFRKIIAVNIPTIESIGGGSARCMLAEVY